jgi:hypothetical protein
MPLIVTFTAPGTSHVSTLCWPLSISPGWASNRRTTIGAGSGATRTSTVSVTGALSGLFAVKV